MNDVAQPGGLPPKASSRIDLLILLIVLAALLLIPLLIMATGYTPLDDVMANAALAVSGKAWDDIMLLRQGVSLNMHNPGWDILLRGMFAVTGSGPCVLVGFAVAGMMAVFLLSGLSSVRRPEAWLSALLVGFIAEPDFLIRITLGRPFILTSAVLVLVLALWTTGPVIISRRVRYAVTILCVALSSWIHGSWYLFALPVLAFLLSGRLRDGIELGICCMAGTFLGGTLTGHPVVFILHHIRHFGLSFGMLPRDFMVGEFKAYSLSPEIPIIMVAGLGWLGMRNRTWRVFLDPAAVLMIAGLLMGLSVSRLWLDWGMPAMLFWLARLFDGEFAKRIPAGWLRLPLVAGLGVVLVLACAVDSRHRWTERIRLLASVGTVETDSSLAKGLPGKDGIIYSGSVYAFNLLFYRYPNESWRYAVGREPAIMRDEDFPVFVRILREGYNVTTVRPWVERMQVNDRLVIFLEGQPDLPILEWAYIGTGLWAGRLPQGKNGPSAGK